MTILQNCLIIIGVVGGIIGALAGSWSLFDRFANRHPRLLMFAPYNWAGSDTTAGPTYGIFIRLSNLSQAPAFLYLETLKAELYSGGTWHTALVLSLPQTHAIATDFPQELQAHLGLNDARVLNRFLDGLVTYDRPLCGYILVSSPFDDMTTPLEAIRLSVFDSHLKRPHTMTADLRRQERLYAPHAR